MKPSIGFTLIEAVMVIVILSVLSMVAIPKLWNNTLFQARGFADQVLATLRYAQKTAIAQHRLVCVALTNTTPATVTLTIASLNNANSCNTALNLPDRTNNLLTAPTAVTLNPAATINFNALGQTSGTVTFTIPNAPRTITLEAETGYVHE